MSSVVSRIASYQMRKRKYSTRLTGSCSRLRSVKVLIESKSVGNSLVILAEVSIGTIIPAVPGPDGFDESRCNIFNVNMATIHETLELGVVGVIPPCRLFLRSSYSWHIVDMRDEGKITLMGPSLLPILSRD